MALDLSHHRTCLSTGRSYHYVDQRQSQHGTTLLCLHGFPDLWYGWRHQIRPWAAQGYRVVIPDMLGYGETDMPLEAAAYSTKRICDDLAALLDHLGVEKAVVIGHDWGSHIASRFALWYPKRLLALAMLSTPYVPPAPHYLSVHDLAERYPSFGYQVYFASEQSTAEIEARLPLFFTQLFRIPSQTNTSWTRLGELRRHLLSGTVSDGCFLSDKELGYYVSNYKRGMTGPLSYYRTNKIRFEEEKDAALPSRLPPDLPVLFIYGTKDTTCPPAAVRSCQKFIDRLKVVPISGARHWIMLEASQIVTETVLQWLGSIPDSKTRSRL